MSSLGGPPTPYEVQLWRPGQAGPASPHESRLVPPAPPLRMWPQRALRPSQPSLPDAAAVPAHSGHARETLATCMPCLESSCPSPPSRRGHLSRLRLRSSWTPRCPLHLSSVGSQGSYLFCSRYRERSHCDPGQATPSVFRPLSLLLQHGWCSAAGFSRLGLAHGGLTSFPDEPALWKCGPLLAPLVLPYQCRDECPPTNSPHLMWLHTRAGPHFMTLSPHSTHALPLSSQV